MKLSFYQPKTTADITPLGALNLLEAIRIGNPGIRFYQASTSEMFPKLHAVPQNEETEFHARIQYRKAPYTLDHTQLPRKNNIYRRPSHPNEQTDR